MGIRHTEEVNNMTETKTVSQEKEELEKRLADLKAREDFEAFKLQLKKKVIRVKSKAPKDPAKKQLEKPKERMTQEIFRVLKQDHNWKLVLGVFLGWAVAWYFSH